MLRDLEIARRWSKEVVGNHWLALDKLGRIDYLLLFCERQIDWLVEVISYKSKSKKRDALDVKIRRCPFCIL